MVDFKRKLAEQRAKEVLDKQLEKVKRQAAPSMNSVWTPRKKKAEEEPPPPDIRELDIPNKDRIRLVRLITEHVALGISERDAKKRKKELTEEIKPICEAYGLDKFQVDGNRSNYYRVIRSDISKELLLANNVSPEVIAKCTITKDIWQFKAVAPKDIGVVEEDDET